MQRSREKAPASPCAAASSTICLKNSAPAGPRRCAESNVLEAPNGTSFRLHIELDLWVTAVKNAFDNSGVVIGEGRVESNDRFFRRRANEEMKAASRAITDAARDRRMQLAGIFLEQLKTSQQGDLGDTVGDSSAFEWRSGQSLEQA